MCGGCRKKVFLFFFGEKSAFEENKPSDDDDDDECHVMVSDFQCGFFFVLFIGYLEDYCWVKCSIESRTKGNQVFE